MPYMFVGFLATTCLLFCLKCAYNHLSENENDKPTTIVSFFTNFTELNKKTIIS